MTRRFSISTAILLTGAALFLAARPLFAQNPPPPPPDDSQPAAPAPPAGQKPKVNADNPAQSAPDQPMWDPLRADKDMEVGKYYMRKGDIDAAIDRFEDALKAKPGYAIPYRYLGEAYEKKGRKKPAVKAYKRYLELFPHAEDADKIQKKIDKLNEEIDKAKNS